MACSTVGSIARDPVVFYMNGENSLSLDLAIVILVNGSDVIDLEVPISGNVNDPEFNFSPAIRRAVTNILTNIAAAPFPYSAILSAVAGTKVASSRFDSHRGASMLQHPSKRSYYSLVER